METVRRAYVFTRMQPERRAVIDVGTNSVKLLVAEVAGRDVQPLLEDSRQTRLGAGFYETRRLQAEPIATTAQAVAAFAENARAWQAASIRVIATSAARDAVNACDLTQAIESTTGLKVEIISGDQEAEWVFNGVTSDPDLAHTPLLLLDVGGGSTEFILGQGEQRLFRHSFPLGTVRLMQSLPHADPPSPHDLFDCRAWIQKFLADEVNPKLESAMRREGSESPWQHLELVGTGGTATILARIEKRLEDFDRRKIEGTRLTVECIRAHTEQLWSLPLEKRRQTVGLPGKTRRCHPDGSRHLRSGDGTFQVR